MYFNGEEMICSDDLEVPGNGESDVRGKRMNEQTRECREQQQDNKSGTRSSIVACAPVISTTKIKQEHVHACK